MYLLEKVRKKYTVFRNYRLTGNLNPDKTFETPELSGLTRSDCVCIFVFNFQKEVMILKSTFNTFKILRILIILW